MTVACLNCGAKVSDDFARVLGDRDGRVHRCVYCSENTVHEAAAGRDDTKMTGVELRA